ncbi:MAG: alanine--glyoxylate aminotransferase family protein [Anaerolineae bacterium]|jgi:aspartate aminotransferase-like enzyme|nr:alanine--glyoxylate aminotransferase family protein [Anaerolineae bacterium]
MRKKLFIPGPTEVRDEILQAMATPMIGHRSSAYAELHQRVEEKVKKLLNAERRVFLFTSASTGVMEGALRNCVGKKVLNTLNGEFSRRWYEIGKTCGIPAGTVEVEPGKAVTPDLVDAALATGEYDTLCLTYNETSTGILGPVPEIAKMARAKYPDVLIMVDAVSCMAGTPIDFDGWGLDVCLAGVQKCFALPPGFAVCAVSERAFERAKTVPNRGYYFDFIENEKYAVKFNTPATPGISFLYALDKQMDCMFAEGLENRYARHLEMAKHTREWGKARFGLFGEEKYLSPTITHILNNGFDFSALNKELGKRGAQISDGYGPFKGKTFRIGHMGDLTLADIKWLTGQIDDILKLN